MIPKDLLPAITGILIKDEGIRFQPYRDSKGLWTIGVGHLIGTDITRLKLPQAAVLALLDEDICTHWNDAVEIFGEEFLLRQTIARQAAILSLVYSLGKANLVKFVATVPAIKSENWDAAADLLLHTKWASDVDPLRREGVGRDDRIAFMLTTGELHADYLA